MDIVDTYAGIWWTTGLNGKQKLRSATYSCPRIKMMRLSRATYRGLTDPTPHVHHIQVVLGGPYATVGYRFINIVCGDVTQYTHIDGARATALLSDSDLLGYDMRHTHPLADQAVLDSRIWRPAPFIRGLLRGEHFQLDSQLNFVTFRCMRGVFDMDAGRSSETARDLAFPVACTP